MPINDQLASRQTTQDLREHQGRDGRRVLDEHEFRMERDRPEDGV